MRGGGGRYKRGVEVGVCVRGGEERRRCEGGGKGCLLFGLRILRGGGKGVFERGRVYMRVREGREVVRVREGREVVREVYMRGG